MLGLAQDWPLLCHKVLDHAATQHARRKIVSCADDQLILTNYGQLRDRALRVAQRLQRSKSIVCVIKTICKACKGMQYVHAILHHMLKPDPTRQVVHMRRFY